MAIDIIGRCRPRTASRAAPVAGLPAAISRRPADAEDVALARELVRSSIDWSRRWYAHPLQRFRDLA